MRKSRLTKGPLGGGKKRKYSYYATKLIYYTNHRAKLYQTIIDITKVHKEKIKEYNKQIKEIKRQLSRVKHSERKIRRVIKAAEEFMSIGLHYSNTTHKASLGRRLIYKYCIEKGMKRISTVMKCHTATPSRERLKFNRSFISKPQNLQLYHDFVSFIEKS